MNENNPVVETVIKAAVSYIIFKADVLDSREVREWLERLSRGIVWGLEGWKYQIHSRNEKRKKLRDSAGSLALMGNKEAESAQL